MRRLIILSVTFLLVSCKVGPEYVRPSTDVPLHYKELKPAKSDTNWKIAQPNDAAVRGEWWLIFNDPVLNDLEAQLNRSNQTIINAQANYRNALQLVNEARAAFFPTLSANALAVHTQGGATKSTSSNSANGIPSETSSAPTLFDNHSTLLDASWQPDLWGSVANAVDASIAGAQSSAALLELTRLSTQALLAQSYFQLAVFDANQIFLDETVVQYKRILDITQHQYDSGVAQRLNVVQAAALLQNAESVAYNNGIARAQTEHAMAVLIGKAPADLSMPSKPLKAVPPTIPIELPSTLLERRPDVAQAERLVAQANSNIGVAIAAYYPTFNLTTLAGYVGPGLNKWFKGPPYWTIYPELSELIFDGGLRDADLAAARATYDANVANYRQSVLVAFQNVEDNLVALKTLAEQSVVLKEAVENDQHAVNITYNQYVAGIIDYVNVSNAKITELADEQTLVSIQGLRMTTAVGLIIALGGGWDSASLNTIK